MIYCFLYKPYSLLTPRIFPLTPADYRLHEAEGYLCWAWGGVVSTDGDKVQYLRGAKQ